MTALAVLRVEIDGRAHAIPEMWLAGFCRFGATPAEAIRHWHAQALLDDAREASR